MDIVLRTFNFPADYDNVLHLWKNAGEGISIGVSDSPGEIQKKLARDPDLALIAETGGEIIGSVIGGFDGRRGMVYHLAVAMEFRKQGLGILMMNELEKRLRARGCLKAYLLIKKGNEDVTTFYEKQGWGEMDNVFIYAKNL